MLERKIQHNSLKTYDAKLHRWGIQVAPEAYFGKYYIGMLASALWSEPRHVHLLSYVPLLDVLFLGQFGLYLSVPMRVQDARLMLINLSMYWPLNCLFIWTATSDIGRPSLTKRLLTARYLNTLGRHMSLFIYLLHVPTSLLLRQTDRSRTALVLVLLLTWLSSVWAARIHEYLVTLWGGAVSKHRGSLVTQLGGQLTLPKTLPTASTS
eukprot:Protomagalhaensia_wolfi_Nauph_80__2283@NODE_2491_length_1077_cov_5_353565_g1951_i0_p1_GENE_NODE_2491_length_1077_cov_5_353565_g1951_i0NODE_2491_length_1077_cov_5_353565_g1951_i0_p1_ORF_typecomplete_len209_score17_09_NODE_2491_length_1077_cov_5_353565_g1951_i04501076